MHRHYSFFILTLLGSVLSSDITTRVQSKAHSRKFATLENPSKVPENIPKTTLTITSYVTGAISASATSAIPLANVKAQSRPVSRLSTSDKTPLSFITNATGDYPCSFPHWKSCKPTGSPAQIQTNYTTSPIIENEYCVLICPSVIPSLPPGDSKETYSRGTMERSTTLGNGTDTTRGSARGPHLTSHFTTTVSSMISQTTKPEMSALPFSAGGKNDQLEKISTASSTAENDSKPLKDEPGFEESYMRPVEDPEHWEAERFPRSEEARQRQSNREKVKRTRFLTRRAVRWLFERMG